MSAVREIIAGRSLAGFFVFAVCIVSLTSGLAQIAGRKCVCTSKACRQTGADVCSTRFSCYTEFILTTGQELGESITTRGCTESATPLLCETKFWATRSRSANNVEPPASLWLHVPWLRLECCDSHDYCNAADDDGGSNASTWMAQRKLLDPPRSALNLGPPESSLPENRDATPTIRDDRQHEDSVELSSDRFPRGRVKALHVAALVLAVAALISVLASCYVVTRNYWIPRGRSQKSHVSHVMDESGCKSVFDEAS
ncbi:hypothetical protein EAI_08510 [Harpegnathos saltator]|uniref:Activin types I and II receptor domain-containing protein n=1 Tax=Harpegnathos saltator TaxID=610380 RepID=E2BEJ9_HARSA|nr:hypothetical protein EAI_08510 [Harpegnathos saltator]